MAAFTVEANAEYGSLSVVTDSAETLTPEEKLAICQSGAQVLLEELRRTLESHSRTGTLRDSLTITSYTESCVVGPKGKHHSSKSGTRNKRRGHGGHHGLSSGFSNRDVGYYLENGTPRMAATLWLSSTTERQADKVAAAMQEKFNLIMEEKT